MLPVPNVIHNVLKETCERYNIDYTRYVKEAVTNEVIKEGLTINIPHSDTKDELHDEPKDWVRPHLFKVG